MSHYTTTTPATARAPIATPDTASICSLASTVTVDWGNEKKGNTIPPAATTLAPASVEKGEAGTKTGSLIIRNLFIIGFLIPPAWMIAIIKVFILDRGRLLPSPATTTTATSAKGRTDIEANSLRKEEKYCEGPYWACLCLVAGIVYISAGTTIAWIVYVEKQRHGA
ncbi:hypothetical protein HOY80DRAFT_980748 [Tuber brumale]|nr:hypothetical protein HOY80DRAFT_980748 [Tuber brumale]